MEATVTGLFLVTEPGLLASLEATWSFLAETGVLGAEGIFSIKSLGSLMAGLTMGHFSPPSIFLAATRSWRGEEEEEEVEEVLRTGGWSPALSSPRTMSSVVRRDGGVE